MKFNKWTLGLATVGAVSLASAARADEKMNSLQTALSNTTISGYVSASANWEITPNSSGYRSGTLTSPASYIPFQGPTKTDGFNLDVVKLTIAKPEDESPWASGYEVDLLFGPDASGIGNASPGVISGAPGNTASEVAIKNAFVTLRTPVGNGIDWKIGVFDTVIGYEASDSGSNPNYTRSYGWAIEPTEHTGILATYKINDEFTVSAGVANTLAPGINARAFDRHQTSNYSSVTDNKDWNKTLMGSATFTAPSSWGWAAGSSIYAGIVYGFNGASGGGQNGFYDDGNQVNYYAGVTLNTPWKQLTAGLAFDYVHNLNGGTENNIIVGAYGYHYSSTINVWSLGLYGTYKVTDKLSLNLRGEYVNARVTNNYNYSNSVSLANSSFPSTVKNSIYELTATAEYDLWANVVTRLEARWDCADNSNGVLGAGSLNRQSSFGLYANAIYKF
jgi:hypothetical protein